MKEKILLFLLLCLELFAVFQWFHCRDFGGQFHYSSSEVALRLLDSIHNDRNVPLWLVRVFHNKIAESVFVLFAEYLQFWNVSFLVSFISLAGIVGLGAQFYQFFTIKKKHVLSWIVFLMLIFVPFIEIFASGKFSFLFRLLIIAFPFITWSMMGFYALVEKQKMNSKIVDILLLLSLWYLCALHPLAMFCTLNK